jgi:hypothetical protein
LETGKCAFEDLTVARDDLGLSPGLEADSGLGKGVSENIAFTSFTGAEEREKSFDFGSLRSVRSWCQLLTRFLVRVKGFRAVRWKEGGGATDSLEPASGLCWY